MLLAATDAPQQKGLYSTTSLARPSSVIGTLGLSALAAFRFRTQRDFRWLLHPATTGRKIHLKGPHQGRRDRALEKPDAMAAGYYLNNIADQLWNEWFDQKGKPPHTHSLIIESRAIFAYPKIEGARARTKEQANEGVRSYLEPMRRAMEQGSAQTAQSQ